jgi:hypothetical protein
MSSTARRLVVASLVLSLAAPSTSWAQAQPDSPLKDAAIGFACVLTSLFYTTAKVVYATAGALTGVTAYALTGGRRDVLDTILNPSLRGDYVVTREHLEGKRRLVFIGPYPEDLAQQPPEGEPEESGEPTRDDETYPF